MNEEEYEPLNPVQLERIRSLSNNPERVIGVQPSYITMMLDEIEYWTRRAEMAERMLTGRCTWCGSDLDPSPSAICRNGCMD